VTPTCWGELGVESDTETQTNVEASNLVDGRVDTAWRCTHRLDPDGTVALSANRTLQALSWTQLGCTNPP
jgi:hypothetical protein